MNLLVCSLVTFLAISDAAIEVERRTTEVKGRSEELRDREAELRENKESTELLQTLILGGKPGVAFPNYQRAPRTSFHCKKMEFSGMYADPEAGCQAYHICHNGRMDTFLCPTGTLFNQELMTCDFWFKVNCDDAKRFYNVNLDVFNSFQPRTTERSWTRKPAPTRTPRTTGFSPEVPTSTRRPVVTIATTRRPIIIAPTTTRRPSTVATTQRSPVYIPPSTTTKRPRTTEDDGPDWVFAWLKDNNRTQTDKRQMAVQDFPIYEAPKTDTAFDFLMANEEDPKTPRNSFGFSIDHNIPSDKQLSRALTSNEPQFVARTHNEITSETGNHPSPWLFPLDPKSSN